MKCGQKINGLTAVKPSGQYKRNAKTWIFQCDCGKFVELIPCYVENGNTKSCGCKKVELCRNAAIRHRWTPSKRVNQTPDDVARSSIFLAYRIRAKRFKLLFTLTRKEFVDLTLLPCRYCGSPPSTVRTAKWTNGEQFTCKYNGIDRLDPTRGYELDNVVPACSQCNYAKGLSTEKEFLDHIRKIFTYCQ